jgi:hypothetical protein
MHRAVSTWIRLGAIALGLATFLLALFPLVRPFFPLDVFEPERGIASASRAFVSTAWIGSHYLAMLGFVLLQLGLLGLYDFHAGLGSERLALSGLVWSLPGVALILPAFGVEAYTMPIVGRLHLAGATGLAPIIALTYRGPMTVVLLLGQLGLAIGAFTFAAAIRRNDRLPTWAGFVLAVGLAFWLPMLPRPVRVIDGFLIGLGGLPLAWRMWRAG